MPTGCRGDLGGDACQRSFARHENQQAGRLRPGGRNSLQSQCTPKPTGGAEIRPNRRNGLHFWLVGARRKSDYPADSGCPRHCGPRRKAAVMAQHRPAAGCKPSRRKILARQGHCADRGQSKRLERSRHNYAGLLDNSKVKYNSGQSYAGIDLGR